MGRPGEREREFGAPAVLEDFMEKIILMLIVNGTMARGWFCQGPFQSL